MSAELFASDPQAPSRFLRTTWLLAGIRRLDVPGHLISIRRIEATECDAMVDLAQRRNVFARHSWENSFYVRRIKELYETTVIEVLMDGELDAVLPAARVTAALVEKVVFISAILGLRRKRTHQLLSISQHGRSGFDLAISPGFRFLRSSQRQEPKPRGIPIDEIFIRRFNRCGFGNLIKAVAQNNDIGRRLEQGVNWLFESRQEISLPAAVVKSSIALESLLIAADSENLRSSLAERAAFLLADEPARRGRISQIVRSFYDLRSGIVHGGRRRSASTPSQLLEAMDRIILLLALTITANATRWASFDLVRKDVEDRKWGVTSNPPQRPFPNSHLSRTLQISES